MIIWTPTILSVSYACVLYVCICTCSAQLSMFHMERRSRNTLIIIIITIIIVCKGGKDSPDQSVRKIRGNTGRIVCLLVA